MRIRSSGQHFLPGARLTLVVVTDVTLGHGCSGPSPDEALQTSTTLSTSVSERGTHTLSVSSTRPRDIMGSWVMTSLNLCRMLMGSDCMHGVHVAM
jgi:hypothetical protein